MAYTKQTWATGDVITAEKLNHMEDGISMGGVLIVNQTVSNSAVTLDKTWKQIRDAFVSGQSVLLHDENSGADNYYLVTSVRYDSGVTEYHVFVEFRLDYTTDSENGYPSIGGNGGMD